MADRYPNIDTLLSKLKEESLAHKLCSCFKDGGTDDDIRSDLRDILDGRRGEIEAEQDGGKNS